MIFSKSLMAIKNDIKILFTNIIKIFNVKSAIWMVLKIYKLNYLFYDVSHEQVYEFIKILDM